MKKIYIKEDRIKSISNESRLLPKHLYGLLSTHTTSLGDNKAFPVEDDYPFDYTIIKQRFIEVSDALETLGLEGENNDELISELSSLVTKCKEMEEPIKDFLEKLCENVVNKMFSIPEETINLTCKLVGKVKPERPVRVLPEPIGSDSFKFKDTNDIKLSKDAVAKRRFINSLIQGAAYTYANDVSFYKEELDKVNEELIPMYDRIRIINDYLLFSKKDEITNEKIMQGAYVETKVGVGEERSEIKSQGIIFPLLLQETIKGFFEVFSVHGLPNDRKLANYIIRKADFIKAEPWDMRFGTILWKKVFGTVEDTNVIPYAFTELIEMPCDEFNLSLNEILSSTDRGDEIMDTILRKSYNDNDYQEFKNSIVKRNLDKSVISDGYFSAAELDGFDLDGDDNMDGDVIEEDGENQSIETYYRGICGKLDKLKYKRQIWLADNPEYAAEYAWECEDGHLYEFDIDSARLKPYDWYYNMPDWWEPIDGLSEKVQNELINDGYNCYTFPLDEADVLVLLDSSLIVGVREIPLEEYLEGNK